MPAPSALFPFVRTAWRPVTEAGDGPPDASKVAGTPWIPAGGARPACPNCGRPIQLFLQLNTAHLPEAVRGTFGDGLLQLFYCTSQEPMCDVDCQAFFPFADSVVARLVVPEGAPEADPADVVDPLPPRRIVGWEAADDYPSPEEAFGLGAELSDDEADAAWEAGVPLEGDKLAGWPLWVQSVEYPDCPRCGTAMRLVYQIDSEDHLPWMFGDAGTGHLTQCPEHKDVLGFGWACT